MIKLDVRGVAEVSKFLSELPRGTIRVALQSFTEYIIGNDQRGLKHYPKRVEHDENNPYQWQSEKQRRAYFATDGFGEGIPYKRTDKLKNSWTSTPKQNGYIQVITNEQPYADYVQGVEQQRGHWADGWKKQRDIIKSNMAGAMRAANQAVDKWIKEHKKS